LNRTIIPSPLTLCAHPELGVLSALGIQLELAEHVLYAVDSHSHHPPHCTACIAAVVRLHLSALRTALELYHEAIAQDDNRLASEERMLQDLF
jgi:hypothetical protein